MPKKKRKHPRLPNGWGSIRHLGGNRTNPYAVHPPVTEFDQQGNWIRPKPLCYVDDWYVGFAVLNAYRAGTYKPGDELSLRDARKQEESLDTFCRRVIADAAIYTHTAALEDKPTFADVYERFYEGKYGANAEKKLSKQSKDSTRAAYNQCSALHSTAFADIKHDDLQRVINDCPKKSATKENMVSLIKQMYRYAILHDIVDRNYSDGLQIPNRDDDEHGVPFSEADLQKLWQHKTAPTVEMILIMCYSGFRIAAYKTITVNTTEWYFQGGVKTAAGKDRIVPIHTAIRPLVRARLKRDGKIMENSGLFRKDMYSVLENLGIDRHTPHDCRHTFSALCEKFEVKENDRKRMLGHAFADVTNKVYGHRELEALRAEIEKIKAPEIEL